MINNITEDVFEYIQTFTHLSKQNRIVISDIINEGLFNALNKPSDLLDKPESSIGEHDIKYSYYIFDNKDENGLFTVPESIWIPKRMHGVKVDKRTIQWYSTD